MNNRDDIDTEKELNIINSGSIIIKIIINNINKLDILQVVIIKKKNRK